MFLDNGELDLGVVRDSVLNQTNDYLTFADSFEAAAQFGPAGRSYKVRSATYRRAKAVAAASPAR